MTVLTNVKNTRDGPTVQFSNNQTMSVTITENIHLAIRLRAHAKRCTYFMDYTVPHLPPYANGVIMTVSPY